MYRRSNPLGVTVAQGGVMLLLQSAPKMFLAALPACPRISGLLPGRASEVLTGVAGKAPQEVCDCPSGG